MRSITGSPPRYIDRLTEHKWEIRASGNTNESGAWEFTGFRGTCLVTAEKNGRRSGQMVTPSKSAPFLAVTVE